MPNPVNWTYRRFTNEIVDTAQAQVTVLANGDFVAVWTQFLLNGDKDIFMCRFDGSGQAKSAAVQVNVTDEGNQEAPVVTALANGGLAIAWVDHGIGQTDVRYRIYNEAGQPLNAYDQNAYANSAFNETALSITSLEQGKFSISFLSEDGKVKFYRSFDENGNSQLQPYISRVGEYTSTSVAAPMGSIIVAALWLLLFEKMG